MQTGSNPKSLGALLALALLCPAIASGATYGFEPGQKGNLVTFLSKAPLESIEGKTDQVEGTIDVDLADLGDSASVRVTVDLASLDTGISMRNEHMRDNHLQTDEYPTAVFEGGRLSDLSAKSLAPGGEVTGKISGVFHLHGVTRPLEAQLKLTREDGESGTVLRVHVTFGVKLSDYAIKRPQFLVMKLSDLQKITVNVVAVEIP